MIYVESRQVIPSSSRKSTAKTPFYISFSFTPVASPSKSEYGSTGFAAWHFKFLSRRPQLSFRRAAGASSQDYLRIYKYAPANSIKNPINSSISFKVLGVRKANLPCQITYSEGGELVVSQEFDCDLRNLKKLGYQVLFFLYFL